MESRTDGKDPRTEVTQVADRKFFASKEELEKAYMELKSSNKIAKKFGVCKKTILVWMNNYGIPRNHQRLHPALYEDVLKLASNPYCLSSRSAAKEIGVTDVTVNSICRELGIAKIFDKMHLGFKIDGGGYVLIKNGRDRASKRTTYMRLAHKVVQNAGLWPVKGKYVVHHKDGNKKNNCLSNLEVMSDFEHRSYHAKQRHCGWGKRHDNLRKDIVCSY